MRTRREMLKAIWLEIDWRDEQVCALKRGGFREHAVAEFRRQLAGYQDVYVQPRFLANELFEPPQIEQ